MKISGLYHDPNGVIEKSGALDINFRKHLPGGAYEIEIGYGPTKKISGMFPQDWNHAKVVEKALEVYDNAQVKKYSTSGNEYLVFGKIKEGINVLWIFEVIDKQSTGKNITIYPLEKIPESEN